MLEVIAETLADAHEAWKGGADRLELVRDLDQDGLTPSLDLVAAIAAEVPLPLRVMVREKNDFTADGLEAMVELAGRLAEMPIDGIVVGFLDEGRVDLPALDAILGASGATPVTFHRAFDALVSDEQRDRALRDLLEIPRVDHILTSGGAGSWQERAARMDRWQREAGDRLTILAGGGMSVAGVRVLREHTKVREFHIGRAARTPDSLDGRVDAAKVRDFRRDAGLD